MDLRFVFLSILLSFVGVGAAAARDASKSPQLASKERAQYCAAKYQNDFYPVWVKNHCLHAPYGPRFEYLVPAWDCLCLGNE